MITSKMKMRPVEILLVEDNPVDAMIIREAFNGARGRNNLHVTVDGEEAMDFLHKQGKYCSAPSPQIILLDLNLPRKDGREILAQIKADASIRHIPVIVLTTSEDPEDIRRSYELQANCFITKPFEIENFTKAMECLGEFWFAFARLPESPKGSCLPAC
jgi:two-component system, chemotaxis family, response regulator Rcp1